MIVKYDPDYELGYPEIHCAGCNRLWFGGGRDLHGDGCPAADLYEVHGPACVERARWGYRHYGLRSVDVSGSRATNGEIIDAFKLWSTMSGPESGDPWEEAKHVQEADHACFARERS